jgi:hypothetical protein
MNLSVESLAMDVGSDGEESSMQSLKRSKDQKEEEPKKKPKWETINVVVQRSSNSSEVTMETHPHLFWKECVDKGYQYMIYINNRKMMDLFTEQTPLLYLDLLPIQLKTIVNKDLDYAMNRENVERKAFLIRDLEIQCRSIRENIDTSFSGPEHKRRYSVNDNTSFLYPRFDKNQKWLKTYIRDWVREDRKRGSAIYASVKYSGRRAVFEERDESISPSRFPMTRIFFGHFVFK